MTQTLSRAAALLLAIALLVPLPGHAASSWAVGLSVDASALSDKRRRMVAVEQAFADAALFFETVITGYALPDAALQGVAVTGRVVEIDGWGGVLGRAGPDAYYLPDRLSRPIWYSAGGIIELDLHDTNVMLRNGTLFEVLVHEMAHVLGFGTFWTLNGLYDWDTGRYTGAAGVAAYNAEFGLSRSFVPVELDGGPGTANAHWDEGWAGGAAELLTGTLEGAEVSFSDTSLQSFRDLGYTTLDSVGDAAFTGGLAPARALAGTAPLEGYVAAFTTPVPLPPALAGLAAALAGLGGLRLARRR